MLGWLRQLSCATTSSMGQTKRLFPHEFAPVRAAASWSAATSAAFAGNSSIAAQLARSRCPRRCHQQTRWRSKPTSAARGCLPAGARTTNVGLPHQQTLRHTLARRAPRHASQQLSIESSSQVLRHLDVPMGRAAYREQRARHGSACCWLGHEDSVLRRCAPPNASTQSRLRAAMSNVCACALPLRCALKQVLMALHTQSARLRNLHSWHHSNKQERALSVRIRGCRQHGLRENKCALQIAIFSSMQHCSHCNSSARVLAQPNCRSVTVTADAHVAFYKQVTRSEAALGLGR